MWTCFKASAFNKVTSMSTQVNSRLITDLMNQSSIVCQFSVCVFQVKALLLMSDICCITCRTSLKLSLCHFIHIIVLEVIHIWWFLWIFLIVVRTFQCVLIRALVTSAACDGCLSDDGRDAWLLCARLFRCIKYFCRSTHVLPLRFPHLADWRWFVASASQLTSRCGRPSHVYSYAVRCILRYFCE